jgi:hypothetical protein
MKFIKTFEAFSNSFPKNIYVNLNQKDLQEYEQEIFDLINNAYAGKGGNFEIQKPEDLRKTDLDYWIAIDRDEDPDADIILGGKEKPHGTKMTILGQDGSSDTKKAAIKKMIDLMKTRGFYAEMDEELADKMGLKVIKDESKIRQVIDKKLEYEGKGVYSREIAGKMKKKVLVGLPK